MDCDCDFDPYDVGDEDFGIESTHYRRTCEFCGNQWWGLHCPHETIQNPCTACGRRPIPKTAEAA